MKRPLDPLKFGIAGMFMSGTACGIISVLRNIWSKDDRSYRNMIWGMRASDDQMRNIQRLKDWRDRWERWLLR